VGTATEIHDVLRLLFAAAGTVVCPSCAAEVRRESPQSVARALLAELGDAARVLVLAPRPAESLAQKAPLWVRSGLFRAVAADGSVLSFDSGTPPPVGPDGLVRLVVGRHVLRTGDPELAASIEGAFAVGEGTLLARDTSSGRELRFLRGLACNACSRAFEEPTPAHFSFNSPRGACRACQGFGRVAGLDVSKVIPDSGRTLLERPFAPFNTPAYASAYPDLARACRRLGIRRGVPWVELTPRERDLVWNGDGDWYGVKGLFEYLETKRYKVHVRVMIARYRGYERCPECLGSRLSPEARAVRVGGATLPELCDLPLSDLLARLGALPLGAAERARGGALLADLKKRVGTLVDVGLSYLTLSRTMRTLSGGEAQRVQLGAALGNALTGTLYVLDEPTVGLHPSDTARLLAVLRRLADGGNAVCVVEHDLDVIRAADHIIDLGPNAGAHGGELVFEGAPRALERAATATGEALRARGADVAERPEPYPRGFLRVVGARANNLRDLTVEIPTGVLAAVCGPSGSGKSSLVVDVLASGALRALGRKEADALERGAHERIEGLSAFHDVVLVDQSPLGRSARSNPATYTKAWDEVRALWARSPAARAASLTKGSFSFNAVGGRCEPCEGSGIVTVDMQFLADVDVVCDACDGRRFSPEVLNVRVRGRNVYELLQTTVDEALELFADLPAISSRLAPLAEAGLGYLRLGQSTATLSGGEAQRLKIASFLKGDTGSRPTLFLFDEPTTGLHPCDIDVLLGVFRRLLAAGHAIVAVEHNPAFLLAADWLLELGPGGGTEGGRVVFAGSVTRLLSDATTPTAEALRASSAAPATLQSAPSCPQERTATSSSSTAGRSSSPKGRSRSAGAAPRRSASTTSPSRGATPSSRSRTGRRSSRT
jgi:excinuclease ABC subunit A